MSLCGRIVRLLKSGVIIDNTRLTTKWFTSGGDMPLKPKKPLGSFMIFSLTKRQQVSADFPDLSVPEIAKVVARMWRQLDDHEKESYTIEAQQSMDKYREQMVLFRANLTEDDVEMIAQDKKQTQIIKAKKKYKKEMKKLEKPKRPLTAYGIFLQSQLKHTSGNGMSKMVAVGKDWKQMIEDEKLTYKDSAAKAKKDYIIAMEEWEAKMTEQGNTSVVRKKSQHQNRSESTTIKQH